MTNATDLLGEFSATSREFSNHTNRLCEKTLRTGAVLRLLEFRLLNTDRHEDAVDMNDVHQLVSLAAESLPHHYDDVNDKLDDFETASRQAVRAAHARRVKLETILQAMTIAARADSSLADISTAAVKVFEIATADPAHEADWQAFRDAVETHGYRVDIEEIGAVQFPRVSTRETREIERKIRRQQDAMVASVRELQAACEQMRSPCSKAGECK